MKVRLLRGQVVIRELDRKLSPLWHPQENERKVKTHRGRVLGMGPPAYLVHRVEVPWDFEVGDIVQFHFIHHLEAHTRVWPEDGLPAVWVPQMCVDAVIEDPVLD